MVAAFRVVNGSLNSGLSLRYVGTGVLDGPQIFSPSMGENISIPPAFRTKSPHRGAILLWTVREAGPYKGAIDYLKQLDKLKFENEKRC
jgi:hypothetical protein